MNDRTNQHPYYRWRIDFADGQFISEDAHYAVPREIRIDPEQPPASMGTPVRVTLVPLDGDPAKYISSLIPKNCMPVVCDKVNHRTGQVWRRIGWQAKGTRIFSLVSCETGNVTEVNCVDSKGKNLQLEHSNV